MSDVGEELQKQARNVGRRWNGSRERKPASASGSKQVSVPAAVACRDQTQDTSVFQHGLRPATVQEAPGPSASDYQWFSCSEASSFFAASANRFSASPVCKQPQV